MAETHRPPLGTRRGVNRPTTLLICHGTCWSLTSLNEHYQTRNNGRGWTLFLSFGSSFASTIRPPKTTKSVKSPATIQHMLPALIFCRSICKQNGFAGRLSALLGAESGGRARKRGSFGLKVTRVVHQYTLTTDFQDPWYVEEGHFGGMLNGVWKGRSTAATP